MFGRLDVSNVTPILSKSCNVKSFYDKHMNGFQKKKIINIPRVFVPKSRIKKTNLVRRVKK